MHVAPHQSSYDVHTYIHSPPCMAMHSSPTTNTTLLCRCEQLMVCTIGHTCKLSAIVVAAATNLMCDLYR